MDVHNSRPSVVGALCLFGDFYRRVGDRGALFFFSQDTGQGTGDDNRILVLHFEIPLKIQSPICINFSIEAPCVVLPSLVILNPRSLGVKNLLLTLGGRFFYETLQVRGVDSSLRFTPLRMTKKNHSAQNDNKTTVSFKQ
jgi:hypothetical protein